MSIVDDLKISEPGYQNAIYGVLRPIQEEIGLFGTDNETLWRETKERAREHEWFDEFDGAKYGAIIEHSSTDGVELSRYELETDPEEVLRVMALECFEQDIYDTIMEHKGEFE